MKQPLMDRIRETKEEFKRIQPEYPRLAGEIGYVIAKLYQAVGKLKSSEQYAKRVLNCLSKPE
jgi:hypothetical protein